MKSQRISVRGQGCTNIDLIFKTSVNIQYIQTQMTSNQRYFEKMKTDITDF